MHKTQIDLAQDRRAALVELLNPSLADLTDLYLQTKHAHWNVKGPNFIALHELFDKIAEAVEEHIDDVAERVTALGGTAEGLLGAVAQRTRLPKYPANAVNGLDHVRALSASLAVAAKEVRHAIDKADGLDDADTADLFTEVSRSLDKYLWFLDAHLQGDR